MTKCRQCGQLLAPDARSCPACGEPVVDPPSVAVPADHIDERDPEAAADDLLASVVVDDDPDAPRRGRPPWVAPLSERMKPSPNQPHAGRIAADVLPAAAPPKRRWAFWRR